MRTRYPAVRSSCEPPPREKVHPCLPGVRPGGIWLPQRPGPRQRARGRPGCGAQESGARIAYLAVTFDHVTPQARSFLMPAIRPCGAGPAQAPTRDDPSGTEFDDLAADLFTQMADHPVERARL